MENIKKTLNKILEIINKEEYNLEIESKDILVIYNNELEIKLNYVQILVINDKEIYWSDKNEFIDIKTRRITEILKSKLNKSKLKSEKEINKELLELINRDNSIKVDEKNLSLLGIIIEPYNLDIEKLNKYFLITDIINM
jgi:hypothetical protein